MTLSHERDTIRDIADLSLLSGVLLIFSLMARLTELKMRKKALVESNTSKQKQLDGLIVKLKSLTKVCAQVKRY